MKLLFDHHLSPTLIERLRDLFPGSEHVWRIDLHERPDTEIWSYAGQHDFVVISKDADFSEISMQSGFPPKLVWLKIDNWSTDRVEELIRSNYLKITEFQAANDRGILILFKKRAG